MSTLDRYAQLLHNCNYNELDTNQKILVDRYIYDDD